jgi:hypothetical protein
MLRERDRVKWHPRQPAEFHDVDQETLKILAVPEDWLWYRLMGYWMCSTVRWDVNDPGECSERVFSITTAR